MGVIRRCRGIDEVYMLVTGVVSLVKLIGWLHVV